MGYCKVIFVLNDGTKLEDKDEIEKYIHLFPKGIKENIFPKFVEALNKAKNWDGSILYVYQDGKTSTVYDVLSEKPFDS